MDDEDLEPRRAPPARRNLEPMSLEELEAYIGELEDEIARVRAEIDAKRKARGGAENFFKK